MTEIHPELKKFLESTEPGSLTLDGVMYVRVPGERGARAYSSLVIDAVSYPFLPTEIRAEAVVMDESIARPSDIRRFRGAALVVMLKELEHRLETPHPATMNGPEFPKLHKREARGVPLSKQEQRRRMREHARRR